MKTEKLIEKLEKLTGKKVKLQEGFEDSGLSVWMVWASRDGGSSKQGTNILCKKKDIEKLKPLLIKHFEKSMPAYGSFPKPIVLTFDWVASPKIYKKDKTVGESTLKENINLPSAKQIGDAVDLDFGAAGTLLGCRVDAIHFDEDKVFYDIEVPLTKEGNSITNATIIHHVDSITVSEKR